MSDTPESLYTPAVGDVVQINHKLDIFGACFMTITEVKSWGAVGYVIIPGQGFAYYRVEKKDMVYIGRAAWVSGIDEEGCNAIV